MKGLLKVGLDYKYSKIDLFYLVLIMSSSWY